MAGPPGLGKTMVAAGLGLHAVNNGYVFINRYEMVGLKRHGLVLAEQITSIDVQSIIQKCGHVSSDAMRRITRAVEIQTGVYEEGDYDSRRI